MIERWDVRLRHGRTRLLNALHAVLIFTELALEEVSGKRSRNLVAILAQDFIFFGIIFLGFFLWHRTGLASIADMRVWSTLRFIFLGFWHRTGLAGIADMRVWSTLRFIFLGFCLWHRTGLASIADMRVWSTLRFIFLFLGFWQRAWLSRIPDVRVQRAWLSRIADVRVRSAFSGTLSAFQETVWPTIVGCHRTRPAFMADMRARSAPSKTQIASPQTTGTWPVFIFVWWEVRKKTIAFGRTIG